jgi:hypothetical protein
MKHKTIEDCLEESNYVAQDNWHMAGLGETLERNYECKTCGKSWREVYIHSCTIDNQTEQMLEFI